jgi:hypothetical protein
MPVFKLIRRNKTCTNHRPQLPSAYVYRTSLLLYKKQFIGLVFFFDKYLLTQSKPQSGFENHEKFQTSHCMIKKTVPMKYKSQKRLFLSPNGFNSFWESLRVLAKHAVFP